MYWATLAAIAAALYSQICSADVGSALAARDGAISCEHLIDCETQSDVAASVGEYVPGNPKTPPNFRASQTDDRQDFLQNFSGHEPIYFLYGANSSNAKFQVSLKYRLINPSGALSRRWSWLSGLHLTYTQTSFWDLASSSKPFTDTNFKPGMMYAIDDMFRSSDREGPRLSLAVGMQHESNGKDGVASRSLNSMYVEPVLASSALGSTEMRIKARFWAYVGGTSENPDISKFRGYSSLSLSLVQPGGFAVTSQVRGNIRTGRGSVQTDMTYPLDKLFYQNFALYLHGQLLTGYGESLLNYNKKDTRLRIGLSVYR